MIQCKLLIGLIESQSKLETFPQRVWKLPILDTLKYAFHYIKPDYKKVGKVWNKHESRMQWFAHPFQPIFSWIQYIIRYLLFKLINFFCKYALIFHPCNTFQGKMGQGHVYHCVTSSFLLTVLSNKLGTEECIYLTFEILPHSCLIYGFSCSTVWDLHCHILCSLMRYKAWMAA